MDEHDEKHVKDLHAQIAALKQQVAERNEKIQALIGELIKKNMEVDFPVAAI